MRGRAEHRASASLLTTTLLRRRWQALNARFFRGALPPITIEWSPRLTASAGLFVSHTGPRVALTVEAMRDRPRRLIRLSPPLLHHQREREVLATLAHEMIHQWQYDVLKRRPSHGRDFRRKMAELNRGGLGITLRHDLQEALRAQIRYTWQCLACGEVYARQRRTIRPRVHRCGHCRGTLAEVASGRSATAKGRVGTTSRLSRQLELPFDGG